MSTVVRTPASGEMLLFHLWTEYSSGYQDEETEEAKLEVSPDGEILLRLLHNYVSFAPTSGGSSKKESVYSIPVSKLIELIKCNGAKR